MITSAVQYDTCIVAHHIIVHQAADGDAHVQ